jgi:TrmH family RNA methyltransferase
MGAQYRVPIRSLGWPDLVAHFAALTFYLADAAGDTLYDVVDWSCPSVIVVGGEARGIDRAVQDIPHTRIRIPMASGTESLNTAVAASILIYEARRHTFYARG